MIMIIISYNVLQKRLISQKYKKCSPGKYTMLLYVAVSIHWIFIRFDAVYEIAPSGSGIDSSQDSSRVGLDLVEALID